ncbi:ABC transporter ATP-binding protein [Halalkalibacter sp. AB-rgal2]|uniref:ABC transporter ATP-binding protein n=1 Tax=Halalkalibacter sp. AB-rgal2 TaxID=3242695 RepID=UPI00359D9347
MAYIQLNNICFTYPDSEKPALNEISVDIQRGDFVVLIGPSGCGKSTLLKLLKPSIQPHGQLTGERLLEGESIEQLVSEQDIGFVFQDPDNQVVADEVLHELVFGLENIGLPTVEMRNRVAEMVHFLGAEDLLKRKTHELSGGQKQQVNVASILLMQPHILLLDEPTAQLDPVSARDFLEMLVQLNEEFGMTIIIAEHRLEDVLALADQVVAMKEGAIVECGTPKEVVRTLWKSSYQPFVPTTPSLALTVNEQLPHIPLTVKEGRLWLDQQLWNAYIDQKVEVASNEAEEMIRLRDVSFQYEEDQAVLHRLTLAIYKEEIYALVGGNGSGKTTLLKVLMGLLKPQKGKLTLDGQLMKWKQSEEFVSIVGYLPQNPKLFFIHETVGEELAAVMAQWNVTDQDEADSLLEALQIDHLKDRHPYDLSGGELQKAALACILIRKPKLLLLDEPTKGLDPISKIRLGDMLVELKKKGITVFMTTHDIEFASRYATTCGMMFQGQITSEGVPSDFFKGNFFYTTMIQRLFRGKSDDVMTIERALQCFDQH